MKARLVTLMTVVACWVSVAASAAPALDEAAQLRLGKALFMQDATPACAVCHTLKDAGAVGVVGPVLDELKPDAPRVTAALRNGIGQMPSYLGRLDEQQLAALAAYVARASASVR